MKFAAYGFKNLEFNLVEAKDSDQMVLDKNHRK